MSEGWSIPAAAQRLMVSQDTVRTHVKHIYAKIGIHSRDDLSKSLKCLMRAFSPNLGDTSISPSASDDASDSSSYASVSPVNRE